MPLSNTPNRSFYQRSLRASVVIGALATLFTIVYAGPRIAVAYCAPLVWMLANLLLWGAAAREILGRRRPPVLLLLVTGKLLWLGIPVAIAHSIGLGKDLRLLVAFLLGFNTPFLVMFLKSVGRMLTNGDSQMKQQAPDGPIMDESSEK